MSWTTAAEIAHSVNSRARRVTEVVDEALARIAAIDPALNAFSTVTAERATLRARELDASGASGPLAGVPFAVKNLCDVAGIPTLAGSRINRTRPAAARDALVACRLEAAGA